MGAIHLLNLPNVLTVLRILSSFVVLYFGWLEVWPLCFYFFCFAAMTDMVDGSIARILSQRTYLGAVLDPIADKTLMFVSFLVLTHGGFIPPALFGLVLARDLLIGFGVLFLKWKKVKFVFRPTYLSKATTFFQLLTVFMAMVQTQNYAILNPVWFLGVMGITVLLTLVTGFQYVRIGLRLVRESKGHEEKTQTHRQ